MRFVFVKNNKTPTAFISKVENITICLIWKCDLPTLTLLWRQHQRLVNLCTEVKSALRTAATIPGWSWMVKRQWFGLAPVSITVPEQLDTYDTLVFLRLQLLFKEHHLWKRLHIFCYLFVLMACAIIQLSPNKGIIITNSDLANLRLWKCDYLEVFHERCHRGSGAVKVPAGIHGSLTEL